MSIFSGEVHFFANVFRVLIAYDPYALDKRKVHNLRVDLPTLLKVKEGELTIEDVISETYSFQNLDQMNKAFREWLNIDLKSIFFKRKRIGHQISFLEDRIQEIIQYRHGVVHRFELDRSLTKDGYIAILDAIEASIKEFLNYLEMKYQITIERM